MNDVLAIALVRQQEIALELERLDDFVRTAEALLRGERPASRSGGQPALRLVRNAGRPDAGSGSGDRAPDRPETVATGPAAG